MTFSEIAQLRLQAHQLVQPQFTQPAELVAWMGAVQAQDYAGAKWALAQRLPGATDATIEQAFGDGTILRTHLLRPTWHFVAAADIRWMLALTAPRVHALNASYYRKYGLDATTQALANAVLMQVLQGGKQCTRDELAAELQQAGLATPSELRLIYLLMHAELSGLICSGARRGKQFTYALLEERVPPTRILDREEALAELVTRYFLSHGPATVADFVWWSGLTMADATVGLELVGSALTQTVINDKRYWHSPEIIARPLDARALDSPTARLLATYDEFLLSYVDRSASLDGQATHIWNGTNQAFTSSIVIDGRVVGVWRRTLKAKRVEIETRYFRELTNSEESAVVAAFQGYGQFLGLSVVMI